MSYTKKLLNLLQDLKTFGFFFVFKLILSKTLGRSETAELPIKGFGSIHARPVNSDIAVIRQVFRAGEYDIDNPRQIRDWLDRRYHEIISRGKVPVILDAGANIGVSALLFGKLFTDAMVVSVEPDPSNCGVLRRNLDKRKNHVVLEAAIGATSGYVQLTSEDLGWAVQSERAEAGVPVITVRDAINSIEDGEPFIVKVDIEGFEKDLFAENVDWLKDVAALFVEPHDWMLPGRGTSATFQRAILDQGFEVYIKGENLLFARPVA